MKRMGVSPAVLTRLKPQFMANSERNSETFSVLLRQYNVGALKRSSHWTAISVGTRMARPYIVA